VAEAFPVPGSSPEDSNPSEQATPIEEGFGAFSPETAGEGALPTPFETQSGVVVEEEVDATAEQTIAGIAGIPAEAAEEMVAETTPETRYQSVEAEQPASETFYTPQPEPRSYAAPPPAPPPLSAQDERTWAMLAHLSILLNLVTGFFGPIAALIVYLVYQDRSRYVAYHAMQSFVFQLVFWIGAGIFAGVTWAVSGALTVILVGCLLMPIALLISLIPLAALVYGVIGAIQVSQGQDFRYWLVGDWVRSTLTR
jgi:hypothetical protein